MLSDFILLKGQVERGWVVLGGSFPSADMQAAHVCIKTSPNLNRDVTGSLAM
jgi:hypothetical protein